MDQEENQQRAISWRKARIEQIEKILARRNPASHYALKLIKEKQHHEMAVAELVGEVGQSSEARSVPKQSSEFSHTLDYRSVTLRGKTYSLTGQQAHAIKILHEAYKSGNPDVGVHSILTEIEAGSRLRDTFRSSPGAWKGLVKIGKKRGTRCLNM